MHSRPPFHDISGNNKRSRGGSYFTARRSEQPQKRDAKQKERAAKDLDRLGRLGLAWLGVYRSCLVLVGANQRLLVVVGEVPVFESEVAGLPAREVFALLHQVTLRCHTSFTPATTQRVNGNKTQSPLVRSMENAQEDSLHNAYYCQFHENMRRPLNRGTISQTQTSLPCIVTYCS